MFTINVRGMLSVTTDEDQINLTLMGKIYTKFHLFSVVYQVSYTKIAFWTEKTFWIDAITYVCLSFCLDLTSLFISEVRFQVLGFHIRMTKV